MDCPKCGGGMAVVEFGLKVELRRCRDCAGLFCEAGVLDQLRGEWLAEVLDTGSAATGRMLDEQADLQCPACGAAMVRSRDDEQSHIYLDVCSACRGTFLDAGELTDIKSVTLMDRIRALFQGAD